MKHALAALALTLSGAAAATDTMTADEMAAVQLALDRGQLLYAYDQAAWHATDAMVAQAKAANAYDRIIANGGGYIIEGDSGDQTVTFYDRSTPPKALFRARMVEGGTKVAESELITTDQPLTQQQQRLARERRAVLDAAGREKLSLCAAATPNITVLPPVASSKADVAYVMTPQTVMTEWPLGGHYRYDFTGEQPGEAQPFTKTCIPLSNQQQGQGTPQALVITQLLGDTPTEIHVFTVFASHLPLYVVTPRTKKIWAVEVSGGQARIRQLDQSKK